jgi:NAD(P)-dependent dehydrogenase (short-subunit alcohol dehydrogenase family)
MRSVIMGGTSGIGLATAHRLAAAGHEVIVTGRNPDRLAAVDPTVATAESLDGTDFDAVRAFFERIGPVDHLVLAFSQGASAFGPVHELDWGAIRDAFDGKLFPYLNAIRCAEVTGSITLISAASARGNYPGTVILAAANGAIERLVSPLAAELAPVRVNAVAPGAIDTPWWGFLPDDARAEQFAAIGSQLPAGRVGTADEVADAIAYLAGASYVTGTILPVDGGFTVA